MTDLQEKAMRMALELFEKMNHKDLIFAGEFSEEIEALRQALAQSKQKPMLAGSLSVRYFRGDKAMTDTYFEYLGDLSEGDYTLYTAPPKREWVGLTDEQRHEFVRNYGGDVISKLALVKAIESKLKEKNT